MLSRLSLRSLSQFTCVSKQWRSTIANICTAKTRSPTVLLVSDSKAHTFSPHSINENAHVKSVYVPWRIPWLNMRYAWLNMRYACGDRFGILGSCNGLVLLHINEGLFLWNPLTRFFKKVLVYDRLGNIDYEVRSGLCYDSTRDEYKAVLALSHNTPDYGGVFVTVGSFRSKSWTRIDFPYVVDTVKSGPIVNGNLHWLAKKKDSGSHFLSPHQIIYFNAHMDKFEEVPMPEPRGEDGDIICGFGVLDGCLCMSRLVHPGYSDSNVEVLLMKEYGVRNSWAILSFVPDCVTFKVYDTLVPLGYTKNGEVVTKVNDKAYGWQIWALTKSSYRRISVPNDPDLHVIEHEESLITPTDYGWEEEELKGEATYVENYYKSREIFKMGKRGYYSAKGYLHREPSPEESEPDTFLY